MMLFSRAFTNLKSGCCIRYKNWPEDYYIYKNEENIIDSMGNCFAQDMHEFYNNNSHIFDNAGPKWEIYDEVRDINL
jgi:hypothetical protein